MARFNSLDAWLHWQEQLHPRPIDLGLERVAEVYRQLDLNRKKPPTVTVAGTNGKGSCIAFLEAIYGAQGYKVGAYTSPHILRYNERIRINGQAVDDAALCEAFTRIDDLRGDISLSYFEFGTLTALILFAAAEVDVQLLEVGLGGRLDAVNIVDPDAAILTTIAIDHVDWLGNTMESIGREKAGIFRRNVPAIIADGVIPASVTESIAGKQAIPMQLGRTYAYRKHGDVWDWLSDEQLLPGLPSPAFKGEHQYRNASAVLMAIRSLQTLLPVDAEAIARGLQNARLQGRFQLIPGNIPVLLDVGHNPQAVQTLVEYLQESFPAVKIHAVFAMMKDKDIPGVLSIMQDHIEDWFLAPLKNPRAAGDILLKNYFQQLNIDKVNAGFADFPATMTAAENSAQPGDLILVFGSFFLVSEYLSNSQKR
jgi:dihydrofolate synthase/folylpolyglutamate synthase